MVLATAAQMKEIDRIAIEERGIPSLELMERAAEGVAAAAEMLAADRRERTPFLPEARGEVLAGETCAPVHRSGNGPRRAAVFAGPGNNGGDGVAAARLLAAQGWEVRVFLVGDRTKLTPDNAAMVERLDEAGLALEEFPAQPDAALLAWCLGCDVYIDEIGRASCRERV